jgi:hypothetical protein
MKPVLHRVVAVALLWCVVPVFAQTMAPAAPVAVQAPASAEQQADAVRRGVIEREDAFAVGRDDARAIELERAAVADQPELDGVPIEPG